MSPAARFGAACAVAACTVDLLLTTLPPFAPGKAVTARWPTSPSTGPWTDNPRYSMALLLREALDSGAPPSMARLPMTPEEVAAAYDAAEAAEDAAEAR